VNNFVHHSPDKPCCWKSGLKNWGQHPNCICFWSRAVASRGYTNFLKTTFLRLHVASCWESFESLRQCCHSVETDCRYFTLLVLVPSGANLTPSACLATKASSWSMVTQWPWSSFTFKTAGQARTLQYCQLPFWCSKLRRYQKHFFGTKALPVAPQDSFPHCNQILHMHSHLISPIWWLGHC